MRHNTRPTVQLIEQLTNSRTRGHFYFRLCRIELENQWTRCKWRARGESHTVRQAQPSSLLPFTPFLFFFHFSPVPPFSAHSVLRSQQPLPVLFLVHAACRVIQFPPQGRTDHTPCRETVDRVPPLFLIFSSPPVNPIVHPPLLGRSKSRLGAKEAPCRPREHHHLPWHALPGQL